MSASEENTEKSIGGNLWKVLQADDREVDLMMQRFGLPYLMARVLVLRGVLTNEAENFLEPKIQKLMPDPKVLKDMDKAAARTAAGSAPRW